MTNKEVIERCLRGTCNGCKLECDSGEGCDFFDIYGCYPCDLERLFKIGAINRFWQNMEYGMKWAKK